MKNVQKSLLFLLAIVFLAVSSCKKDDPKPKNPELTKFSFEPASNPGITSAVEGVFTGNQIHLRVPNSANINELVATFAVNQAGAIVYANDKVQQSGSTKMDFATAVKYRVVTESGMNEYTVNALTNASIVSFGFFKEDNDGVLFKDYEAEIKGLAIAVNVPVDADVSKLVARFTTSAGATVKVGGQAQTTKVSVNNFTSAVTYEVTDAETTSPEKYVVTVGRLTAPAWAEVPMGELAELGITSVRMAIHPTLNTPYLVYVLGSTAAPNVADRKATVVGFNGTSWSYVGAKAGISVARADEASIAFDTKGVLYAAYKDYDATDSKAQYASVQKFQGDKWSYVGSKQFNAHRVSYMDLAIGDDDVPVIGYLLPFLDAGLAKRSPYSYRFENSAWVGKGFSSTSAVSFSRTAKGNDGLVYFAGMDISVDINQRNPSIYRWRNNAWEVVGSPLVSPGADIYGAALIDVAASEDGQVYIVFQSLPTAEKKSYVMHYNGSTWKQIGDEIDHTAGSNAERDNIALAVHPNGTLYLSYGDATGLFVRTYNTQTNNWNAVITLSSQKVDKIDMKISNDGIPYIATTKDSKPVVYKFDIPSN